MEPSYRGTLGAQAEGLALRYLISQGLTSVARNFHRRGGEIDLIMLDGGCLVFVEVRYRSNSRFSSPLYTVDIHKQRRIVRAAALFVASQTHFAQHTMRFDVVAVEGAEPIFNWLKDAFRPTNAAF